MHSHAVKIPSYLYFTIYRSHILAYTESIIPERWLLWNQTQSLYPCLQGPMCPAEGVWSQSNEGDFHYNLHMITVVQIMQGRKQVMVPLPSPHTRPVAHCRWTLQISYINESLEKISQVISIYTLMLMASLHWLYWSSFEVGHTLNHNCRVLSILYKIAIK